MRALYPKLNVLLRFSAYVGFSWIFASALLADEAVAPQAGQTVAFLGDSITALGWENPTGFIHLVSQALAMHGSQINVISAGVKGDTSKGVLSRLKADVLGKKPDWI